jgi:hypothetical protein
MAIRVIDPKTLFAKQQRDDRFEIKMRSNLCIPSFTHAYSMGVEYARDWFLSKMPIDYFKKENGYNSIHVNEKFVYDDYRKLGKAERLKKAKPFLTITPQLNFDFDLENVHMYNYGPELLASQSWSRDSFFRDGINGLYLLMNMQIVELKVNYRVSLYSRAQQLDLFKKMEIWFRIGATESQDRDMDFHIPSDVLCNLALLAGFDVDIENQKVKDPIRFTRYLNAHSAFPIMYKFRKATGNYDYFLRAPMMNIHANIMDKLAPDDGEMSGQLRTNFNIDMSVTFRYPAPQFYVLYTKDPSEYKIPQYEPDKHEKISYDICTYKIVDIPLVNNLGWEKFVWSKYEYDEDDCKQIDLNDMIGADSEFRKVIDYTKSMGISPEAFMDIRLFTGDPKLDGIVRTHIDWNSLKIIFDEEVDPQLLYLAIYVDLDYYNSVLISWDDSLNNRMVQHKDQQSLEMVMSTVPKKE